MPYYFNYSCCCGMYVAGTQLEIDNNNQTIERHCAYSGADAEYYYVHVHTPLSTLNYSVIPFIAMLSMNIAIFVRLKKRDRQYTNCATIMHNGSRLQHRARRTNCEYCYHVVLLYWGCNIGRFCYYISQS